LSAAVWRLSFRKSSTILRYARLALRLS
jgi:hypothetical protein